MQIIYILSFNSDDGTWEEVDQLQRNRYDHGANCKSGQFWWCHGLLSIIWINFIISVMLLDIGFWVFFFIFTEHLERNTLLDYSRVQNLATLQNLKVCQKLVRLMEEIFIAPFTIWNSQQNVSILNHPMKQFSSYKDCNENYTD